MSLNTTSHLSTGAKSPNLGHKQRAGGAGGAARAQEGRGALPVLCGRQGLQPQLCGQPGALYKAHTKVEMAKG